MVQYGMHYKNAPMAIFTVGDIDRVLSSLEKYKESTSQTAMASKPVSTKDATSVAKPKEVVADVRQELSDKINPADVAKFNVASKAGLKRALLYAEGQKFLGREEHPIDPSVQYYRLQPSERMRRDLVQYGFTDSRSTITTFKVGPHEFRSVGLIDSSSMNYIYLMIKVK